MRYYKRYYDILHCSRLRGMSFLPHRTRKRLQRHPRKVCVAHILSSYTGVHSVIDDSGSVPRRAIYSSRETSPEVGHRASWLTPHEGGSWLTPIVSQTPIVTLHPTPHTLHPTPYALHPTPYTLHPTPHTLHPTPYTLHPTPYTLHPTPYTLHPTPYTLHLTPYTLHPTPYTLHPYSKSIDRA